MSLNFFLWGFIKDQMMSSASITAKENKLKLKTKYKIKNIQD